MTQTWEEIYSKFQEMQQAWIDHISSSMKTATQPDYATMLMQMSHANQTFFTQQATLLQHTLLNTQKDMSKEEIKPLVDARFQGEDWEIPVFDWLRQYYLLSSQWMLQLVHSMYSDELVRARCLFFTQQFLNAMSPANFLLTNPEAINRALQTQGESLKQGLAHLLQDVQKGHLSLTDESQFEVGVNVATTEGAVIFENELIQILQYTPLTERVYEKPLLIVPPCVNKYYLMDLQKEHSMVRYLVEQGHCTFLISWKTVTAELKHLRWDDYIEKGVLCAMDVIGAITKQKQMNTLGFCIGGIILSTALCVDKARGQDRVASLALMASMLDHQDPGEIRFFIDDALVRAREARSKEGGVIKGSDLAMAFSLLRANDLIWKPFTHGYLLGENPSAFDLLYWNSDSTNLALPMHTFFLRKMYLENALTIPNKVVLCDTPIDLRQLSLPTYLFGAHEDHITPWKSVYGSIRLLGGKVRFVLGASGHVAGSINPVSKNKRNYWVNEDLTQSADDWFTHAQSQAGSWWQDLLGWQKNWTGKMIKAPKILGSQQYPVIEPAPGRYVKEKASS